ncbi:hypothetical protein H4Q26_003271 [Puccinia striiformis f. sp. tritici PST-130]|nr:hypothetical protein H4Q26_003271 [Puccinia striiformis f. sp. tritici PST-130]
MIKFDKEPCSNNNSMAEDQSPKVSNSFRVSTINNISIKSETEDFSALINNPEDRTYLGRTLAKEYLGIKEEFYQAYHQFSAPPKHPIVNISGQNKQALEDSVTKIIPVNIPYDTRSRKFLVNNQDISLCSSHFLVGLMRPSAKLGEEDWAKALELKHIYNFQKTEGSNTSLEENKSKNNGHTQEKLWDNVRSLVSGTVEGGISGVQTLLDGGRWDWERDTEDGRGEALDKEETEIGSEGGMATIEDGGNCQRIPLFILRTALGRGFTPL